MPIHWEVVSIAGHVISAAVVLCNLILTSCEPDRCNGSASKINVGNEQINLTFIRMTAQALILDQWCPYSGLVSDLFLRTPHSSTVETTSISNISFLAGVLKGILHL